MGDQFKNEEKLTPLFEPSGVHSSEEAVLEVAQLWFGTGKSSKGCRLLRKEH